MSELEFNPESRIALFQRKEIRRVIHNNEWWFVSGEYARPHPGPLPRGEGERSCALGKFVHQPGTRRLCLVEVVRVGRIRCDRLPQRRRRIHPLLGERAGVRASVYSNSLCSGNARRELEKKSGRKVVTRGNYLALTRPVIRTNKRNL